MESRPNSSLLCSINEPFCRQCSCNKGYLITQSSQGSSKNHRAPTEVTAEGGCPQPCFNHQWWAWTQSGGEKPFLNHSFPLGSTKLWGGQTPHVSTEFFPKKKTRPACTETAMVISQKASRLWKSSGSPRLTQSRT